MKNVYLAIVILFTSFTTLYSQVTIVSWNGFVSGSPPSNGLFLATDGIDANKNTAVLSRESVSATFSVNADLIAASSGWDGETEKYWIVGFSTLAYGNLKLTSKQKGSNTGPKNFKVQYKIGNGSWNDLSGKATDIIVANDSYVSGVLTDYDLPAELNNKDNVSLRWLKSTNLQIGSGTTVASTGVNRIDIIIKGSILSALSNSIVSKPEVVVSGKNLLVKNVVEGAQVEIFSALGSKIQTSNVENGKISIANLKSGLYVVRSGKLTQKIML